MINQPVTLHTQIAREVAERIIAKLEDIQPSVFDYVTRNSLSYLARIAQECFNDLKTAETLEEKDLQINANQANDKFMKAYDLVVNLKQEIAE